MRIIRWASILLALFFPPPVFTDFVAGPFTESGTQGMFNRVLFNCSIASWTIGQYLQLVQRRGSMDRGLPGPSKPVCALHCATVRTPPLMKHPVPPVASQTAVRTCATETASAPWGSRVGTANARRAGGDLAAASRWRPPAPTTRTTKEVNWGQWSSGIKRVGSSLTAGRSHSFCLLREMRKESQFGLCQRIGDYGE